MVNSALDLSGVRTTAVSKVLFFLLVSTIVWTTLAYGTVHQPIIAVFYIVTVLILLLWAVDSLVSGVLRFNRSLIQAVILATIVYALIQVIPFGTAPAAGGVDAIPRTISLAPFWTLLAVAQLTALLIYFSAMLAFVDSAERLRKVVMLVTAFGFVFAFFAILQSVLSPNKIYGIYESKYAVPFGSFVNRHNFAAFMEMTIALPLGMLFAGAIEKDKRLIYITAIGLMGIALILSGSRGGLVSMVAAVCFLTILSRGSSGKKDTFVKLALAALMLVVFVVGAILIGGESSLTRFAETAQSNDFSTNRVQIWSVSLKVIQNHFPLGAGLGAFGVAYTPFDPSNGFERVEQAHNDYLEVVADAGIVGVLIGGAFLFLLFRAGFKSIRNINHYRRGVALGAFAGCFSILVHSMFDFVLHITAITLLFLTMTALVILSGRTYADDIHVKVYHRRKKHKRPATVTSLADRRG
jgi:O-antigen ligase